MRRPGRTHMAVASRDQGVDATGAAASTRGARTEAADTGSGELLMREMYSVLDMDVKSPSHFGSASTAPGRGLAGADASRPAPRRRAPQRAERRRVRACGRGAASARLSAPGATARPRPAAAPGLDGANAPIAPDGAPAPARVHAPAGAIPPPTNNVEFLGGGNSGGDNNSGYSRRAESEPSNHNDSFSSPM